MHLFYPEAISFPHLSSKINPKSSQQTFTTVKSVPRAERHTIKNSDLQYILANKKTAIAVSTKLIIDDLTCSVLPSIHALFIQRSFISLFEQDSAMVSFFNPLTDYDWDYSSPFSDASHSPRSTSKEARFQLPGKKTNPLSYCEESDFRGGPLWHHKGLIFKTSCFALWEKFKKCTSFSWDLFLSSNISTELTLCFLNSDSFCRRGRVI